MPAHGLAALRAGRMHGVALQGGNESADFLHAAGIEPAPSDAAADGEEVRLRLIRAFELVPAFMAVDVELHGRGEAVDLLRVEDEEARKGTPPTVEFVVEDGRPLAAIDRASVDGEAAMRDKLRIRPGIFEILLDGRAARPAAKHHFLRLSRPRRERIYA